MKCERAKELFSEYVEGSIDYALTATVRTHIDQCDDCRSDLQSFRRTWDVIGVLPEVEPPSSFRHDVVMRAARLQHERIKSARQGFLGVTWDYLFGRLLPARAIAIACAGAALAAVLLNVPQYVKRGGGPLESDLLGGNQADVIEASALYSNSREAWQSRILLSNAMWVSVSSTEFAADSSYYELVLSINNKALVRDVTNRIPAQVYILPANEYGVDSGDRRKPMWTGNVLSSSPVHVTVPGISNSQGDAVPVTLLITYQFRKMSFAKIVFIPVGGAQTRASDTFNFADSGLTMQQKGLYPALQALSHDYGKTIIANGSLDRTPNVVDLGADRWEDAFRKVLQPTGLTWAYFDGAVYVDRQFRSAEE